MGDVGFPFKMPQLLDDNLVSGSGAREWSCEADLLGSHKLFIGTFGVSLSLVLDQPVHSLGFLECPAIFKSEGLFSNFVFEGRSPAVFRA